MDETTNDSENGSRHTPGFNLLWSYLLDLTCYLQSFPNI